MKKNNIILWDDLIYGKSRPLYITAYWFAVMYSLIILSRCSESVTTRLFLDMFSLHYRPSLILFPYEIYIAWWILSNYLGNLDVFLPLWFRLLPHHLASTACGQNPHLLLPALPATWVNTLICMTSRNLLTTPSYPAWIYTYATIVLQRMKVCGE